MKTILLTAIGGDIAQGAAAIIREVFPDWRIVGVDMNKRHGAQLYVDEFHRAPAATDPSFISWLEATLESEGVDFCWPFSEAELSILAEQRIDMLGDAQLITPGFKAIEIGNDKLTTSEFLREIGIPAPWTVGADAAVPDEALPCIYKPRTGAGSRSIFTCRDREEMVFYAKRHPGGVFQELLLPAEKEVTCAVYRAQDGRVAVLPLLRILSGGLTGWACAIEDAEITQQCTRLAEAVELNGAMNVQLRLTEAGPRIFEVNARLSSTALMRHKMGFQDAVWTLQEMLGEPIEFALPVTGTIGVRTQGAAVFHPDE